MNVQDVINNGGVFYVSHSGGKDSQAMYALLRQIVPHNQIVLVHADLGEIEWKGVQHHIQENTQHHLNVVSAVWKDGTAKTLFGMLKHRHKKRPGVAPWPSSKQRYCTSDLKRDPIHKFIRQDMKRRSVTLGVNCTGIRALESKSRSKLESFSINKRLTNKSRTVFEWLPIHSWTVDQVFAAIDMAGQKPFWAYDHNERLSCVFCIFGSPGDLKHGHHHRPELYKKYTDFERATGYTMFHRESLQQRVGL